MFLNKKLPCFHFFLKKSKLTFPFLIILLGYLYLNGKTAISRKKLKFFPPKFYWRKITKLICILICNFSNVLGGIAAFAASVQVRDGSPLRWCTDKLVRPRGELRRTGTICRCCLHNSRRSSHMCRNVLLAARTAK